MYRIKKTTSAFIVVLFINIFYLNKAFADYFYTYTGNGFDSFNNLTIPNLFSTNNSVIFSFSTSTLYENTTIPISDITSWYASDGLHHFSSTTGGKSFDNFPTMFFLTNSSGNIESWFFLAESTMTPSFPLVGINSSSTSIPDKPSDRVQVNPYPGDIGFYSGRTEKLGIWSVSTVSPIPEPETYAMLLAGLGLVGFMARRRKESIV
ncbi:MAG: FxDxF family PEP-CTERM protein [Gallionella sp.]|nr:FxDxF family PEP-CTERM protein [Gallionella sp.]